MGCRPGLSGKEDKGNAAAERVTLRKAAARKQAAELGAISLHCGAGLRQALPDILFTRAEVNINGLGGIFSAAEAEQAIWLHLARCSHHRRRVSETHSLTKPE